MSLELVPLTIAVSMSITDDFSALKRSPRLIFHHQSVQSSSSVASKSYPVVSSCSSLVAQISSRTAHSRSLASNASFFTIARASALARASAPVSLARDVDADASSSNRRASRRRSRPRALRLVPARPSPPQTTPAFIARASSRSRARSRAFDAALDADPLTKISSDLRIVAAPSRVASSRVDAARAIERDASSSEDIFTAVAPSRRRASRGAVAPARLGETSSWGPPAGADSQKTAPRPPRSGVRASNGDARSCFSNRDGLK